jgi:hypothetical protein
MYNLCKYKDIFGIPKEGFHKLRIFNIAIGDVLGTFLLAFVVYFIFNSLFKFDTRFWIYLLLTFLVGIVLHRFFCVETTINKLLFYNI